MKGTLFKKVDYNLLRPIQGIEMGEIGLPDIQRPFVWPWRWTSPTPGS